LEWIRNTARRATVGTAMAPESSKGLALANEGALISVQPDSKKEMEILRGVASPDSGLCAEQRQW